MEIKLNSSKLNFNVSPKTILQTLFDFSFGSAITEIINVNTSIETKAFHLLFNVTKRTNFDLSKALGVSAKNNKLSLQLSHYIAIEGFVHYPFQTDIVGATETPHNLYIEPYLKTYKQNNVSKLDKKEEFIAPETVITIHSFLTDYFLKEIQYPNCRENYNMIFVLGKSEQEAATFTKT